MNKETVKTVRGPYKSGIAKQKFIIDTAIKLLIDEGYHNFSFRKVAKKAGISGGNIQHYFSVKEDLVEAMLDAVISRYLDDFVELSKASTSPKEHFYQIIKHVVTDLNSKETTVFFPELWSLANHDPRVAKSMEEMYERYRLVLKETIAKINPKLSSTQIDRAALFISASIEGHTMFIGHGKEATDQTEAIIEMAHSTFLRMIESGDIPG